MTPDLAQSILDESYVPEAFALKPTVTAFDATLCLLETPMNDQITWMGNIVSISTTTLDTQFLQSFFWEMLRATATFVRPTI